MIITLKESQTEAKKVAKSKLQRVAENEECDPLEQLFQ